jgi:hypothetical protein
VNARGERLNNPVNVERQPGVVWQGQTDEQPDPTFVSFQTVPYGYRAAYIILRNYQRLHGLWTIRGMMMRWAPPEDNNPTGIYIANMCAACSVRPDDHFIMVIPDNAMNLLRAMTIQEQGEDPYTDAVRAQGIALAGP